MKIAFALLFLLADNVAAQVALIIPATNRVDWIPGVTVGVFGGIPVGRTISTTLSAGSTPAQINSAITSAATNTIVQLSVGDYTIDASIILKSGVTLKGAVNHGSVFNMVGNVSVRMLGDSTLSATSANIDATSLTKGATNLVLTAGGPAVTAGQYVDILMDNDTARVQIYSGATNKMIVETRKVMAVSGGGLNVQVWPPLSVTFLASNNPLYRVRTGAQIEYAGIEDLFLKPDTNVIWVVYRAQAFSCWTRNVLMTNIPNIGHYEFASLQCEIRHSDVLKSVSVGDGYGAEFDAESATWQSVNNLWLEDNIWDGLYHGLVASGWSGCAVTFNYSINEHGQSGVLIPTAGLNLAHSAGGHMNLIEGNIVGSYLTTDVVHGNTTEETIWRNRIMGLANAAPSTNAHMPMLWLGKGSYWYAAVGNVLGGAWSPPAAHRVYKYTGPTWASESSSDNGGILFPGFTGSTEEAKVGTTFTGLDNYDFYHAAIYNETSLAGSPTVDDSLIYPSKPTWFGDRPWPPIDPGSPNADVTVLPAAYRYINGVDPPSPASSALGYNRSYRSRRNF